MLKYIYSLIGCIILMDLQPQAQVRYFRMTNDSQKDGDNLLNMGNFQLFHYRTRVDGKEF